ncbi:hypothetical protein CHCC5020_3432 [Bacillus licheniformis]|nr:hypothetical protein CHCC5020_3432 [Bacillus licheniformis]TWN60569.1 hypothetical protein CHCC14437_3877 [Bacillus licheniformis]TWO01512.1 hypothetical protein CHCC20486_3117 [Bacillus licheniformis]
MSNKAGAFSIQWMKEISKLDMFHTQELLPILSLTNTSFARVDKLSLLQELECPDAHSIIRFKGRKAGGKTFQIHSCFWYY